MANEGLGTFALSFDWTMISKYLNKTVISMLTGSQLREETLYICHFRL